MVASTEARSESSGPLLPLLDVRPVSANDLDVSSPVLERLEDGLLRPSHDLDEPREDLDETLPRRFES